MAGRDLKDLFRAHAAGDELAFRRAANSLITEEESRSHVALARDLRKILVGGDGVAVATDIIRLPDPPTDRDGGWPLAEVRRPDRYFSDLVLVGWIEAQLREVAEEFRRRRELLEAGVPLRRRVLLYGPPGTGKTTAAEGLAAEFEEVATRLRGLPHAAVEAAVFDAARNRVLSGRSHITGKDLLESADRVKQRPW